MSQAVTYTDREKDILKRSEEMSEDYLETCRYFWKSSPSWSLSEFVHDWLSGWLSGGYDIEDLPEKVISELMPYKLTQPTKLYRAEVTHKEVCELQVYNSPSSWTYNLNIAKLFAEDRKHEDGSEILIVTTIALPDESLLDTTRLPAVFTKALNGEEMEVILMPGIYSLRMVEK